jgi:phosphoserine phosphatase
MTEGPLRSWRDGPTRSAVLDFLAAVDEIPPGDRLAVFDNDGTLWCEQPSYVQLEFFVQELRRAVGERPELAARPEYRAILEHDRAAQGELGLERIAFALVELCEGITPEEFVERVDAFFASARHPDRAVAYGQMVYAPMLELIDELRARAFDVSIVTGGGTEFVRAVSQRLYGVAPVSVVGSQVGYSLVREGGRPVLRRTTELFGELNEGEAKISNIQRQLGRRPIVAGGNSPGDNEMLEYASAYDGPSLALVVDHDDAEREYAYESVAGSFAAAETATATARRFRWTVVSMANDWATVFPVS